MKFALFLLIIFTASIVSSAQKDNKMTADELIRKHQASIGTPEAIAAAKSRILVGQGALKSRIGYIGSLTGPAQFVSDGDRSLLAIIFNSNEYPYEKLAFDGKNVTFGRPNGSLTRLGEFVKSQPSIVKQGLFGGVLSSSWPITAASSKHVKIEYGGTETIGEKMFYKLKVRPSGGDVTATLYFESDTFHHVITEYRYSIQAFLVSSDSTQNPSAKASHFTLTEKFWNFKKVGDLVLPLGYALDLTNQLPNGTEQLTWTIGFTQAFYNEPLEPAAFKVS